jgi:histidine ammonia-lyase
MGANAATQCYRVIDNVEKVLAIELMTASQALAFRRPLKTSPKLEAILEPFRKAVPFVSEDRVLHDDMIRSVEFLRSHPMDVN